MCSAECCCSRTLPCHLASSSPSHSAPSLGSVANSITPSSRPARTPRLVCCGFYCWLIGFARAEHLVALASGAKYLGPLEAEYLAEVLHVPIALYIQAGSDWRLSSLAHPVYCDSDLEYAGEINVAHCTFYRGTHGSITMCHLLCSPLGCCLSRTRSCHTARSHSF